MEVVVHEGRLVKQIQNQKRMRGFAMAAISVLWISCAGCTTGGRGDVPGIQNFGQVTPEVWRGSKPDREGMQWLAQQQVKTIIDLQMDDESRDVPAGVQYVPIRAPMWHCDQVDVAAVIKAIDESPKPVFIHCLVGRDRTGLAVAAWQMSHGMSAEEAIAQMERFGSNPYFSDSIKRRIRELEKEQQRTRADKSAATAR
jgi:protein tyrosine phosphatase (PTP) superfamily phosphohydrolase (DUF442 family)